MGRVDDTTQHLNQLNKLYLSTIETLAMAIDAKDQITHGHIRRVQAYAVGLAKSLGIIDQQMIQAIEAAALLHDMGKLAVPEYILNKPGKLTFAEFEKMKLHASVGADILSAIEFPYPVVPIVRHHHENWDGTGYPDRLRGTDIPIGARILSVVDCFDALTSDRPYRPRMTNDEAIRILLERRGTMYDPLMVDTFIRVHKEIAPRFVSSGPPKAALNEITSSTQTASPMRESQSLTDNPSRGVIRKSEFITQLIGDFDVSNLDSTFQQLRKSVPFSLAVLYLYQTDTDELVASYATGDAAQRVVGLRMTLGRGVSGWVAVNRQAISNADPMLDLADAGIPAASLNSSVSVPFVAAGSLVGVLTLYSTESNCFRDHHRQTIESVLFRIDSSRQASSIH